MNNYDIKKTMGQVHISEEMQEDIIMNIEKRMGNEKNNMIAGWKKHVASVAVFIFIAGVVSVPVYAIVENYVKARMDNIPKEEIQSMADTIQKQNIMADSFSREYYDSEKERIKDLEELYKSGTFPKNIITQVNSETEADKETLCYIKDTGTFHLPVRELTDEELLEIIDFGYMQSYTVEQTPDVQEEKESLRLSQEELREQIQSFNGITEEEAVTIATEQMHSELGDLGKKKELLNVFLVDLSNVKYAHEGNVAYVISFGDWDDKSSYTCEIDSANGNVLNTKQVRVTD